MAAGISITDMIAQSRDILASRSVAAFERHEKSGTLRDAVAYVALAGAITGLFGLSEGIGGFIGNIVFTILGFLIFTYIVHWLGSRRGGTGTLDEVAYSFALFWAPLSVLISVITLVAIAGIALNVYFAYLATQASMNLSPGGQTWGVLLLAALASFVLNAAIGALLL